MFCTRNLIKLANISRSQQVKLLNQPGTWTPHHTSSLLSQQSNDHPAGPDKSRIYYGTLTPNMTSVKIFSLSTSFAGLIAQPLLYEQADKMGSSTPVIVAVCGFVGFFTFITPFLLNLITKRYVTEMRYDPFTQEYTAVIITFFLRKKPITFKVEDVIVPEVPGMFTTFLVKTKEMSRPASMFVDPKLFYDLNHYAKLMGFDKPMDFKLNLTEEPKENK